MRWQPFPMPHLSPHFPPDCVCGGWERWGPNAQVPPWGLLEKWELQLQQGEGGGRWWPVGPGTQMGAEEQGGH